MGKERTTVGLGGVDVKKAKRVVSCHASEGRIVHGGFGSALFILSACCCALSPSVKRRHRLALGLTQYIRPSVVTIDVKV